MYPKLSSAWPKRAALALALSFAASSAAARPNGIESAGCEGCHAGGPAPDVVLAVDPASFRPGDSVTLMVTIAASNVNVGGFYLRASNGYLAAISGAGTKLVSPLEMTHSSPRAASQGSVSFRARWTAPDAPGGAYFQVWALAANGDGRTSGDGAGDATLTRAFGCERGTFFHADFDGDGYASANSVAIESCSQSAGFSAPLGDCDDNDELIHPGAAERCNQRDDNCNQQTDEGIEEPRNVYLDSDGDGYGVASRLETMTGCSQLTGYSARAGDCDDHDSNVHPGATEVCNGRDDNCDGRVDELVRPVCGVGMCRRAANSCEPSDCIPGSPTSEVCNFADDDCNGVIDDVPAGCAAAASGAGGSTGGSDASAGNGVGGLSASGGTSFVAGSPTQNTREPSETGCSLRQRHSSAPLRWSAPAGALGLACLLVQRRASQRRRKHVSRAHRRDNF
jgi:hypothetical protein